MAVLGRVAQRQKLTATNTKMKTSKLTLVAAIALGGLMVCGPITQAQDKPATPPSAPGDATTPPPGGRRGNNMMQTMFDRLNLTPDQQAKVKPVIADQQQKMRALREDKALSQQERRDKIKEIIDATDAKLKEILTPDQYTKLQDFRKQARSRGRRPGLPGGAGGTPPAAPKPNSNQ